MVQFGNLNRRFKTPADKAVRRESLLQTGTTEPNFQGGIQDAWRGTLDENPLQNDFYQSAYTFREKLLQHKRI